MHAIFFNPPIDKNYLGHQMSEVYRDKIFEPFMKKDMTIVDIGANIGVTSYYFSQFAKQVHSIEPVLEHFDILSRMIQFNKLDNVKPHNLAVYNDNEKRIIFHNTENKTMCSLIGGVKNRPDAKEELTQCVTLDKFFKDNKIEHVDLMKMDIEGTEMDVICGSGFRKVADKIDTLVTEVHKTDAGLSWTGRNLNQLTQTLKQRGFTVSNMPSDANILVAKR